MPFSGINKRSRSDEKEVILERQQFLTQVDALRKSTGNLGTVRIAFPDGDSHRTHIFTIEVDETTVRYLEIHAAFTSPKIVVLYVSIARVELSTSA